jgi:NitT/TauT family transport system permease protein
MFALIEVGGIMCRYHFIRFACLIVVPRSACFGDFCLNEAQTVRQSTMAINIVDQQPTLSGVPVARQPRRDRFLAPFGLFISLTLLLLIWKLVVVLYGYAAFILPAPEVVLQRLIDELLNGTLRHHVATTLIEAVSGFGLALTISMVLGYLLAHAPRIERILAPQIAATQAIPAVAIAPLIILWVGSDIKARILVAMLVTFFPILSSTIVALRGVSRELLEMARISGATRWQVLWHVELPLALPGIFGGVKAGLALATTGAVVGEFVGGRDGLGALINIARGLFDTPLMFAALAMLAALTLGFYLAASLLERFLMRWDT